MYLVVVEAEIVRDRELTRGRWSRGMSRVRRTYHVRLCIHVLVPHPSGHTRHLGTADRK